MKQKLLFPLCMLLLSIGTACHRETKEPDYADCLKIGYLPSTDVLPYVVALQQGICDSLGIKVRLVPMLSEENRDTLFRQAETDGSILSPIEALLLQKQGCAAIPAIANEGLHYLVASNDSNLVRMEQLQEKCLSVAHYTASEFFADKVLERLGIDEDHINKPTLSTDTLRLRMLVNQQIDAAVLRAPFIPEAEEEGCKVWASSRSYPALLSVTAFSDSILQTKGEEIRKLLIAYNAAVAYMNGHPQETWLPQAASAAGLPATLPKLAPFREASVPSQPDMEEIIRWMQGKNMLPTPFAGQTVPYPDSIQTKKQ